MALEYERCESAAIVRTSGMAHVEKIGDLSGLDDGWIGAASAQNAIEGFVLFPHSDIPWKDLKYKSASNAPDHIETEWVSAGEYCGTRGMARLIDHIYFKLEGLAKTRYYLVAQIVLSNGDFIQGASKNGELCLSGPTSLSSFRLEMHPVNSVVAPAKKDVVIKQIAAHRSTGLMAEDGFNNSRLIGRSIWRGPPELFSSIPEQESVGISIELFEKALDLHSSERKKLEADPTLKTTQTFFSKMKIILISFVLYIISTTSIWQFEPTSLLPEHLPNNLPNIFNVMRLHQAFEIPKSYKTIGDSRCAQFFTSFVCK